MLNTNFPVVLASQSPRRKELFSRIISDFKICSADINESIHKSELPSTAVKRLAKEKLQKVEPDFLDSIIISADTIVVLNGTVLGKPKSKKHAGEMLRMLSNKKHFVYTGIAVKIPSSVKYFIDYERTAVIFNQLNAHEIETYIKSGNPLDKAGAYGIQDDIGSLFIKEIRGCYYNVVGLPLSKLYHLLKYCLSDARKS